jgi:tripartite-type tricarboxylate transporter receptor subunit TctC
MEKLISGLALLTCLAAPAFGQQTFPSQAITLVVPYAPGGAADLVARSLGNAVSTDTGQNVVVENRPGGATVIGAQATLGKPADGYTGLVVAASFVINPHLMHLSFNPLKDFQPVALLATNPHVLVVSSTVPVHTLPEFVDWARGKKGSVNYSSFGNGSSGHIGFELLKQMTGIEATHVAYKGGAPSTMALVSGEVDATLADIGVMAPYIKAGRVKAIAITGATRSPVLPNVPTFAESGLPKFSSQTWVGLWVRSGVPNDRIQKLNQLFTKATQSPEIQKFLSEQGMQAQPMTSDQFKAFAQSESDKYQTAIETSHIKLE